VIQAIAVQQVVVRNPDAAAGERGRAAKGPGLLDDEGVKPGLPGDECGGHTPGPRTDDDDIFRDVPVCHEDLLGTRGIVKSSSARLAPRYGSEHIAICG